MSLAPDPPHDFDSFWLETVEEAMNHPLDFERRAGKAYDLPGFSIETYRFEGMSGEPRFGWIAVPEGGGSHPAFLWVPPYGRESLLPNAYGTRSGFVSASLNFFGHEAFHQERYTPERGYFAEGVMDPKTWIMRRMFQDAVRSARILREQPEVEGERVGAMGMSQGGGISIWLGAWVQWIGAVCADMPFLGGVSQTLGQNVYRYPLKELIDQSTNALDGLDRIKATLRYYDTLNQATRCSKPTHVSLGEKDPAVRPPSVEAIYAALPETKGLDRYPVGHDWYPAMVDKNQNWLIHHLDY